MRRVAFALLAVLLPGPSLAEELIQVDVQVLEINKTKLYKIGLDWTRLLEGGAAGAMAASEGKPVSPVEVVEQASPPLSHFGTFSRGQVDAFLKMVEGNNYGKLLAKPKLLTINGMTANFLVGGELPVVNQDSQGRTSVDWKQFGVKLQIKPERKDQMIRTHVRAEASNIDNANAVTLPNGTFMPAIKTRWAETDVELASRSTVIIAGLIQTETSRMTTGLPVLMDLPLLGWLFRHTRDETIETELVIFVTPSFATAQAGTAGT